MSYTIRLPEELGKELEARRTAAGISISELAQRAGKSRAVIYRLERGEEASVSSLLSALAALGLSLRFETAELPSMKDTAGFFEDETGDEDAS